MFKETLSVWMKAARRERKDLKIYRDKSRGHADQKLFLLKYTSFVGQPEPNNMHDMPC